MASSSSAHPSASEAEEPPSPQLQDQAGWEPIPTNDWELRLDKPAWVREGSGSGSEAALAHPWRAAAAAAAVRAVSEEEEEEKEEEEEEEEEDHRTVPSLGDPRRAAVAAAAARLMREVEPSPPRLPPTAVAPSRAEREARAELDKRLSDVTPRPDSDDARFIAAAEKILERRPLLVSDLDLTCSSCGEELDGRTMLRLVLELPAKLRTDRLMMAATKWLDEHPASSP